MARRRTTKHLSTAVWLGTLQEREQRVGEPLRLDPVRRVEVMALRKGLDREVREDLAQPVGHPAEVVRVASAAEGEVDRPVERFERFDIEISAVKRLDDGSQTIQVGGGPSGGGGGSTPGASCSRTKPAMNSFGGSDASALN